MSFQLTTQQVIERRKTVTRRYGWNDVKIGEVLNAVEKCMGLKRGEKMRRLGVIRVVGFRKEPLNVITDDECIREGFPEMNAAQFVEMLCRHSKHAPSDTVNRIEFEYI